MKLAIIGSRNLTIENISNYVPKGVNEIVSGGALGIDTDAENYAKENNLTLKIFLPDYQRYKRGAPFKRNQQIAEYADECLAFWDGHSKGTKYTIDQFKKLGKNIKVIIIIIIINS